jgi:hypothetical protein
MAHTQPFSEFRDDESVPLICPTCQVFGPEPPVAAAAGYFAWGCFRYFWWGAAASERDGGVRKVHRPFQAVAQIVVFGLGRSKNS